ncbi:MAG TPA: DUF4282 domain-containing protein [Burkholderiales bacterium]
MESRSIFFFDNMLTPKIITFVYWLLLFAVVIGGFGAMFGFGMGGFSFGSFLKGVFGIVIGAVLVRIWCELLIVLFKINENVQKIAASK